MQDSSRHPLERFPPSSTCKIPPITPQRYFCRCPLVKFLPSPPQRDFHRCPLVKFFPSPLGEISAACKILPVTPGQISATIRKIPPSQYPSHNSSYHPSEIFLPLSARIIPPVTPRRDFCQYPLYNSSRHPSGRFPLSSACKSPPVTQRDFRQYPLAELHTRRVIIETEK
jgi:hypothetical protein